MHLHHETPAGRQKTDVRLATFVAAFASVGGAAIHAAVIRTHWEEWALAGLFFAGAALFQLVWAVTVLRYPRVAVISLGLVANLGFIAVWGVSRGWGVPFGPSAGVPEAVGTADVLAVVCETAIVLAGTWVLLRRERTAAIEPDTYRCAVGGVAVVVAALATLGMSAGLEHSHGGHQHGGTHHEDGGHHEQEAPRPSETPGQRLPTSGASPKPSPTNEPAPEPHHDDGSGHSHG